MSSKAQEIGGGTQMATEGILDDTGGKGVEVPAAPETAELPEPAPLEKDLLEAELLDAELLDAELLDAELLDAELAATTAVPGQTTYPVAPGHRVNVRSGPKHRQPPGEGAAVRGAGADPLPVRGREGRRTVRHDADLGQHRRRAVRFRCLCEDGQRRLRRTACRAPRSAAGCPAPQRGLCPNCSRRTRPEPALPSPTPPNRLPDPALRTRLPNPPRRARRWRVRSARSPRGAGAGSGVIAPRATRAGRPA